MKAFRVLSCVIYAIIENFVCIDYIYFKSKKLRVICMDTKYLGNGFNEFLGTGIPYLLMNLLQCHGFMNNINSTVILLCTSRIQERYFSKGLVMLKLNSNNLTRIVNKEKERIYAMDMNDSDYVMTCTKEIPFISKIFKKLFLQSDFYSTYIQTIYNVRK